MTKPYSKSDSTRHAPREQKEKPKPKPIAKKSAKRKAADIEYNKLRNFFLIENTKCAVYSYLTATEVHHKYSGKDRDKYYLDTTTWLPVSREGHNWIHNNPKKAREEGYLF